MRTLVKMLAQRAGLWFPWLLAAGIAVYSVFGPSGLLDYREIRAERLQLEERIAELEEANRHLAERIDRLEKDPIFLESLAREKLGVVRPSERVVVVPRELRP